MATKVYELTRMSTAFFTSKFCGIPVEFPFTEGRGSTGNNRATFTTSDRFTQDAVENDPRFGKLFYLAETIKSNAEIEEEARKAEEEAKKATDVAETPAEPSKPKKGKKNTNDVPEVRTLNDAYDYFANMGIAIDGKENLEQTMRELKVSFPNLEE